MDYSPNELMIVSASRALEGSSVVFVGVGLPNIACNLARNSHSPQMELVYESGVFGAQPARLPLSIGDPTLVSGATSVTNMTDLFMYYLQGGLIDAALLGGAQIDRFGNLNTTVIGDYSRPKVRLPGSGGACEIAINAKKTFMIMPLKGRAFVETLNFHTSPGHLSGKNARQALKIPGQGPALVITDRALFSFNNPQKEMMLIELAPGETGKSIQEDIGWTLHISPNLKEIAPPTSLELEIIRNQLDPKGIYR
jgi:glutaconate CoA-transferase, subunit B